MIVVSDDPLKPVGLGRSDSRPTGGLPVEERKERRLRGFSLSALTGRAEALAIADQVVVSGASFVTGAIIGRFCSKDEFGLYMLGISIVLVLVGSQASLVTQPYTVFIPRLDADARARLTGSVVVHQWLLSAAVAAALLTVGLVSLTSGGSGALPSMMVSLALVLMFILFKEFARSMCFGNMNFKAAVVVDSVASILQVALLILLAVLGFLSASSSFMAIGFACAFAGLIWMVIFRKKIVFSKQDTVADLKKNLAFGKWLFFSVFIWNISLNIYPWILAAFHGADAVGVFAACVGVVAIVHPVTGAITNYSGPKIAHSFVESGPLILRKLVSNMVLRISYLIAPFCVLIFLTGGWISVLIYGEKYANLNLEISVLALNIFVVAISIPLSRALHTLERADLDFYVNLVPLAVVILVGVPLVMQREVLGAAMGLLAGNLAASAVRWAVLWRVTRELCTGMAEAEYNEENHG